jgi:hypothetical protein
MSSKAEPYFLKRKMALKRTSSWSSLMTAWSRVKEVGGFFRIGLADNFLAEFPHQLGIEHNTAIRPERDLSDPHGGHSELAIL